MSVFIGYHGTKNSVANRIIDTNFTINHTNPGWLGSGVYFFEENNILAKSFGNYKNPGNTSVIRAEIEVPDHQVFDLTNPSSDHSQEFHAFRLELLPVLDKQNINVKAKNEKDFDGKILNMLCSKSGYQLVRANTYTYQEYDRANRTFSRFPNGTELCLKNIGYIKNKVIV